MSANEKTINTFATRVRQMILKFDEVKQENAELYAMVDERDAKIKALEEKLAKAQSDYDSLKMAKMIFSLRKGTRERSRLIICCSIANTP